MDIAAIELFRVAGSRMEYLAERHRVVAQNVVNANTPGYRARDLVPFDAVIGGMRPVAPALTSGMHLTGTRPAGPVRVDRRPETWESNPDGNAVSLEQEMIKAADTREAYGLIAGLFQKHVGLLRMAWSGRNT
ncbi:flagellar basal body protein [Arenibaculum sp.]|uniref:flagellar basal body protein n=1 Tax=Arenibaculum sp. TaxID=2865862 RepID=UPI002E148770|nr:flagellar basal body protein [Arenibaculum sp.]